MSAVLKEIIRTIAERHAFGTRDYSLTWDGGQFDPSRSVHELIITVADGSHSQGPRPEEIHARHRHRL
jgi:hypothetical protein